MKPIYKTLSAAVLLACGSAQADSMSGNSGGMPDFSGNVALTSNYVFRGVSQTDDQMAIQGGFDYDFGNGFYAGTWASNVDSSFFTGPKDPQTEVDLYAGYSGELSSGIGYDVGVLRYEYPGGGDFDTTEVYVKGSYKWFTAGLNYTNELNFLGSKDSAYYLNVGASYDLPKGFGLSGSIGLSDGDAFDGDLPNSYMDYAIGLSKSLAGLDLALTYTATNSDGDDMFVNDSGSELTDKVVFTVSKSL